MTTYMRMCISLKNATACKYDIPNDTVSTQSTVIREIRVYPAKGPMPRASEALFASDIVRCTKSWTTVDAGRCSQCGPTNGHQEEDTLLFRERSPGRRRLLRGRAVTESLPKNLITAHPVQARARVALLYPFLSFSIKMNNFQPNKLSQRSVKISYGIKPYNA